MNANQKLLLKFHKERYLFFLILSCNDAPKKIKMSITGNGNASKEQVAAMLKSLMSIKEMPKHLDASDGLAAAVCHFFQKNTGGSEKAYSGWSSFIKNNPKRLG